MDRDVKQLFHELKHHLPFAAFATLVAAVLSVVFVKFSFGIGESIFRSLHILHLLASGTVTSAIFYKYKKSKPGAVIVGVSGAIVIGTLSDIILPWLGASVFQLEAHLHLSLLEMPFVVLGTVVLGSLIGMITLKTEIPHSLHVGLSVFASMFYLITYVAVFNTPTFVLSFLIVLISVVIPCCISDILYPFLFLGEEMKKCDC